MYFKDFNLTHLAAFAILFWELKDTKHCTDNPFIISISEDSFNKAYKILKEII